MYRIPVDFEIVRKKTDPQEQKENELFRQMLACFHPPHWARPVIVVVDSAYVSRANFKAIKKRRWFFGMACARTWKFADGQALRTLGNHLPRYRYRRIWVSSPNGKRRRTYWVYAKRTRLRHIGDVTVVLSKQRRNDGPKKTKILVTNLPKSVAVRNLVVIYQRRWHVELLIGELKGGTGLGQHQITKKVERVEVPVEYEEALRYDPNAFQVHYNMAVAYERVERHKQAVFELERYLELKPDAENREETEGIIEQLREKMKGSQ